MPDLSSRFKTPAGEALYRQAYAATLALWPVTPEPMDVPTRFGCTHVNACGPLDAPPLVLLHAQLLSSTSWYLNVADFSRRFRVYALDTLDDYGLSVPEGAFHNSAECVGWLRETLDGLGIARARLAGLSYGGWLALTFALAAPERVERLVLMSPANSLLPIRREFFIRAILAVSLPLRFLGDSFTQWLFATPGAVARFGELVAQIGLGIKHIRPVKVLFPNVFSDDELRRLSVPTLLLVGDREVIYDPHQALERAARLVPGIQTYLVPGAGHAMIADQPWIVDDRILEFLTPAPNLPPEAGEGENAQPGG